MPLLTLSAASLAFGSAALLDNADFQLDAGERVALIGRNGCGKSSLLRTLAGRAALDDGEVWRAPGLTLGYVAQEPPLDPEMSVFEAVVAGMGEISALLAEYHAVAHALGAAPADDGATAATGAAGADEALLDRLHTLQGELEARDAWAFESNAERVIERFSLDPDARVGSLSGGQKKRLALAQALALSPDVLLLDEPTNHLDIAAIEWLEELLVGGGKTLLFITHDRRFLDRVATRIVELDRGRLTSFPGSFADYLQRKERMLQDEAVHNAKFDKFLAQEEVWIRKGVEARRTRNEGRVLRLEGLRRDRAARRNRSGQVALALDSGQESGKLVAELVGVGKSFGEGESRRCIVRDFSCRIQRGDKIGLIGANGAGKTTLLRLILGELAPDAGSVRLGSKLQVAYFDQFRAQLDENATLVDVISPGSDFIEIGGEKKHVISYLGDFLFPAQRARSPVRSLSGGERNRLLLARLFARPANVLVLDEPTNDLDIETLELLEQRLQDYSGTLFLVSHDRAFLDNVVTQTIAAEGDGLWREYVGGYQDWADWQAQQRAQAAAASSAARQAAPARQAPPTAAVAASRTKLSYKEARELDALPGRIAELEAEQKTLSDRLEDPSLYAGAGQEAQQVSARLAAIDDELLVLLERWEALEARS
jgi:ATP-binding cassette subfamily F protein uup